MAIGTLINESEQQIEIKKAVMSQTSEDLFFILC